MFRASADRSSSSPSLREVSLSLGCSWKPPLVRFKVRASCRAPNQRPGVLRRTRSESATVAPAQPCGHRPAMGRAHDNDGGGADRS